MFEIVNQFKFNVKIYINKKKKFSGGGGGASARGKYRR